MPPEQKWHLFHTRSVLVEAPDIGNWISVDAGEGERHPGFDCPQCGGALSSLLVLPPCKVELELHRGRWPDVLSGSTSQKLFSRRSLDILTLASLNLTRLNLNGIATAVSVNCRRKSEAPPEYIMCHIQRGPTAIDLARSCAFPPGCKPTCNLCLRSKCEWDALAIDERSWDGADLFEPFGLPGRQMCTTRFRDTWEDAGLRGAVFLTLDEYVELDRARR